MSVDLKNLDIEFILDKSGSMGMYKDCPGGKSRWDYAQEFVFGLASQAEKYDPDGITVVPYASWTPGGQKVYEGTTADKVATVFSEHTPGGSTNTAGVLQSRLNAYFDRKAAGKARSTLFFVMTDGFPDDAQALKNVIINTTKRLDRDEEMAIQFVRIGQDESAKTALTELDDGLQKQGAKFDIVDTCDLADIETIPFPDLVQKSFDD